MKPLHFDSLPLSLLDWWVPRMDSDGRLWNSERFQQVAPRASPYRRINDGNGWKMMEMGGKLYNWRIARIDDKHWSTTPGYPEWNCLYTDDRCPPCPPKQASPLASPFFTYQMPFDTYPQRDCRSLLSFFLLFMLQGLQLLLQPAKPHGLNTIAHNYHDCSKPQSIKFVHGLTYQCVNILGCT